MLTHWSYVFLALTYRHDFHMDIITNTCPAVSAGLLNHWGRAMHICISKLTIIASDNGLSPGRCQAIIWNNTGILSIVLLGTNFSEILIEILTFSFKKMHLKVLSAKWQPFCLGLNVLISARRRGPWGDTVQKWQQLQYYIEVGIKWLSFCCCRFQSQFIASKFSYLHLGFFFRVQLKKSHYSFR